MFEYDRYLEHGSDNGLCPWCGCGPSDPDCDEGYCAECLEERDEDE